MRKIIVLEHISLDGVIQAPGGRDEDPSGGFQFGGWTAPYHDDTVGKAIKRYLDEPCDLLLGRKTFDIWEPYWPNNSEHWPNVMTATKYVASNTRISSDWQPTVFLGGDVASKIGEIKKGPGSDIHVWGSGELVHTLLKEDLVDALFLMTFPVVLGSGKRLFTDGVTPAAFKVSESVVAPSGVVVVNYERAGDVEVGNVAA